MKSPQCIGLEMYNRAGVTQELRVILFQILQKTLGLYTLVLVNT